MIDKLVEDHWLIAGILRRVRDLVAAAAGADPAAIVGELDGLAAIVDSHFALEERRISAALDAATAAREELGVDRWPGAGVRRWPAWCRDRRPWWASPGCACQRRWRLTSCGGTTWWASPGGRPGDRRPRLVATAQGRAPG